jgi:hypothetical protein
MMAAMAQNKQNKAKSRGDPIAGEGQRHWRQQPPEENEFLEAQNGEGKGEDKPNGAEKAVGWGWIIAVIASFAIGHSPHYKKKKGKKRGREFLLFSVPPFIHS